MQPWDRWWNRHFPPYSYRRLGFLLACLLFIAPGVTYLRSTQGGEPFSWTFAAFLWVGTATMLLLSWIHIRGQADLDDLDAARRWRPPGMPPPPPPPDFPPDVWRDGRDPELPDGSDIEIEARRRLLSGPARKPPRLDALYSFVILFIGFTGVTSVMSTDPLGPMTLGMNAAFAAFTVLLFVLRYSILSVILLSAVCAVPMAMIMHLFFFWLGGGGLFQYWAISFVMALLTTVPFWLRFRETRKSALVASVPMWMLSTGASVMLLMAAGTTALMDDPATTPGERPQAFAGPSEQIDLVAHERFGGSSPEDAALRLFFAWKNDSRTAAGSFANERSVAVLFSETADPAARFLGCGKNGDGEPVCAIWVTDGLLLLSPYVHTNGNTYIEYVEKVPHGHPFTPDGAPTPTG